MRMFGAAEAASSGAVRESESVSSLLMFTIRTRVR